MADTLIDSSLKLKILRVANVVSLLIAIGANVAALFAHPNMVDISNSHPTYFTPPNLFVGIFWLLLLPLLLGFVFYVQFIDSNIVQALVSQTISWYFVVSNLFFAGWAWFWLREEFVISAILIFFNTVVLFIVHQKMITYFPPTAIPVAHATKIIAFIHTPFSMYSAFALLDLSHSLFIAFTNLDEVYKVVACVVVWLLAILGIGWTTVGLWSGGKRDGVFGATIAWILIGIAIQQREVVFLSVQSIVLAIAQIFAIIFVWIRFGGGYTARLEAGQRQPLLRDEH
ncbi:hypothetical protein G9A89_012242 [Geosiphon pyriformis]|nr:hypothetical protein G9A89_012242 [Geosiphon pyriformis]